MAAGRNKISGDSVYLLGEFQMAKKVSTDVGNRATAKAPDNDEGALISVAKTLGRAAGQLAVKTGLDHAETPTPRTAMTAKPGKIASKNKTRLPRREKKALQKSAGARV
jgi:hypothetical protein